MEKLFGPRGSFVARQVEEQESRKRRESTPQLPPPVALGNGHGEASTSIRAVFRRRSEAGARGSDLRVRVMSLPRVEGPLPSPKAGDGPFKLPGVELGPGTGSSRAEGDVPVLHRRGRETQAVGGYFGRQVSVLFSVFCTRWVLSCFFVVLFISGVSLVRWCWWCVCWCCAGNARMACKRVASHGFCLLYTSDAADE